MIPQSYARPDGVRMLPVSPGSYVNEVAAIRLGLIQLPRP